MSGLQDTEQKLTNKGNIDEDATTVDETIETMETRWKYAVFPAMVAFIVLAGFGFYLIYGMLQRMEDLSSNVEKMTNVIKVAMPSMQNDMSSMSNNMQQMNTTISGNFPELTHNVATMSSDMKVMSHSTTSMAMTTHNLGRNMWELNKNVSKPLSLMNNMIPWNSSNSVPPPRPMPAAPYPRINSPVPAPVTQARPVTMPIAAIPNQNLVPTVPVLAVPTP